MTSFHETRFPTNISLRSSGGPERLTRIVSLASGHEQRSTPWAQSRRHYDAGYGVRSINDIHAVIAFFEARMGRLIGFRWKDWTDYRSSPPSTEPTPLDQRIRPITKPVEGTIRVAINGTETTATLDSATGLIEFAAPPAQGAEITAGFEFDTPVRFDTDRLDIDLAGFEAGAIPSIPLVEVRV